MHKHIQIANDDHRLWSQALMSSDRHTISRSVTWVGRGVHSGTHTQVSAFPYHPQTYEPFGTILCGYHLSEWQVVDTRNTTVLFHHRVGSIKMTEHLFAALFAAGIDDIILDVKGEECPILDGSAFDYLKDLTPTPTLSTQSSSTQYIKRQWYALAHSLKVTWQEASIEYHPSLPAVPSDHPLMPLTIALHLHIPPLALQNVQIMNYATLYHQVIPAKTFGFLSDEAHLRKQGLIKGVTHANTNIYDHLGQAINPPHMEHEAAYHKVLDTLGDFYRLGKRLKGHLNIRRGGHHINQLFMSSQIISDLK